MTDQTQKRNLHQRVQAVQGEIGRVPATGKNQFKSPAVSIEDVENELRPHLAKYGIITRWAFEEDGLQALSDGKLWMVRLRIEVVNADDPTDSWTDRWYDIGTTPLAATSFAVKGYYKRLFHIASAEDESGPQGRQSGRRDDARPPASANARTDEQAARQTGSGQRTPSGPNGSGGGAPGQRKGELQTVFEEFVKAKGARIGWRTAAVAGANTLGIRVRNVDELDADQAREVARWGRTQIKQLRANAEGKDEPGDVGEPDGDGLQTGDATSPAADASFEEFE